MSVKIVSLFNLSSQMLSEQKHYDWGLRALKTCLNSGGQMLSDYIQKNNSSNYDRNKEYEILLYSIRINTCPKLTYDDQLRFDLLMKDIFPEFDIKEISFVELEQKLKETINEQGL